ncbi:MAG: hypothetical protein ACYC37_03470 [Desulfobacteria bacterium]
MSSKLSKADVAAGVTTMSKLIQRRAEIGARLDQTIDELGRLYGELVKVQTEVGRKLYNQGGYGCSLPAWVSEVRTAEVLRNRLAMELAEHSSGPGNETVLGPVRSREALAKIFETDHAGVVAGG